MSNLEKIQKGMRVLQILSKIILIFAIVGVALASIGEWNRYDDAGGIALGICLILLSLVVRYGAELERS